MTLSIPDFGGVRALVAGDAMLDEYWFGDAERISPEAPVPVVNTRSRDQRPGGAANVALNVAALGAQAALVAVIGRDRQGEILTAALEHANVRTALVASGAVATVHKLRVLARNQQLIRLDAEQDLAAGEHALRRAFADELDRCNVVVLSDYGKGTLAGIRDLISRCIERDLPVLVDPKGTDFTRYRGATVLTPNQTEFAAVAGKWRNESEFLEKAERMSADLELGALLVTRGSHGMTLCRTGHAPVTHPAQAREVFDVTGAGDTVIASMATAIAAGLDYENAAALANLAAGIVIAKIGVASVSRAELHFALHRRGSGGRRHMPVEELVPIVEDARRRGERIVMTNGCFDILHAGHVAYLEEAKSLGDRLIVAVNDDASVRRLKGAPRPIVPLEDRIAVLAGLASVDWVVSFDDDTPLALIEKLLPDVLVKGGDWQPQDIVGSEVVLRNGGEVRSLRFVEGRSTSSLIDAIRGG
jgi:D-beta-D-heptose 7-phosphate kinase / D-beta-D-heptose 1-phosphate adenosyltransferase